MVNNLNAIYHKMVWVLFLVWLGFFLAVFHAPVPKFYNKNDFFVSGTFLGMQNYVKESDLAPQ